jgi:hypothetical protein
LREESDATIPSDDRRYVIPLARSRDDVAKEIPVFEAVPSPRK